MTEQLPEELCACGLPLHYASIESRDKVEKMIALAGNPDVVVSTPYGTWLVPRHYIALHGIKSPELPALAARYGWAPR